MNRKNISVMVFLILLICSLASGCKINTKNNQGKKRKKKTKGVLIFFAKASNKKREMPVFVIWRMNPNGERQRKAFFGGRALSCKGNFSMSRDGRKIVWSPPAIFSSINIMNTNGSSREIALQADPSSNIEYLEPTLSPNEKRIAFTATEWEEPGVSPSQTYIGRVNIDKSDLTTFTPSPYEARFAGEPSYSPDGSEIAFTLKLSDESSQIVRINSISGEVIKELTPKEFLDSEPTYTPSGRSIVFVSNREEEENIFIMQKDGTNIKQLTFKKKNKNPSISPGGKQIAFSSNRNGNWEIYVMNIDGTKQRRLTKNSAKDSYPQWSKEVIL